MYLCRDSERFRWHFSIRFFFNAFQIYKREACVPRLKSSDFHVLLCVHLGYAGDQVEHLVRIAPLVIVPGDQLDKMLVEHDAY